MEERTIDRWDHYKKEMNTTSYIYTPVKYIQISYTSTLSRELHPTHAEMWRWRMTLGPRF